MMQVDYRALTLVERREGFVYLQPQPYGEKGTGTSYEAIPPFGLLGRPRGPTGNKAANGIVLRHGPEGFVIATTDPRYQDLLPDAGDGGAGIYATIEQGGESKTPYVAIFGADGDEDEGLFRVSIPSSAGTTTIEIDPSTGDVTITHPSGTKVIVKDTGVELGAEGGQVLVLAPALTAWAASVNTALAALGQTISALAGHEATKVKGT
jgi:hypothetical protein